MNADPEPTIEYAIESCWQHHLLAMGFKPGPDLVPLWLSDLRCCTNGWLIQATWSSILPLHVAFTVGAAESHFIDLSKRIFYCHCTPSQVKPCALIILKLADQHPFYDAAFMAKIDEATWTSRVLVRPEPVR